MIDKLQKLKKKWRSYSTEFAESDYMDIEDHTSMALEVGGLISIVEEQQKEIDDVKKWHKKDYEEMCKLQDENARLQNEWIKCQEQIGHLEATVHDLREALKFYADKDNYEFETIVTDCDIEVKSKILEDGGEKARQALKE